MGMAMPHRASAFPSVNWKLWPLVCCEAMGKHLHLIEWNPFVKCHYWPYYFCVCSKNFLKWRGARWGTIRASGFKKVVLGNSRDILGLQCSISGAIIEFYYCEVFHEKYLGYAQKSLGHSWGTARWFWSTGRTILQYYPAVELTTEYSTDVSRGTSRAALRY